MIINKRLVLFVLIHYYFCALSDNASASQNTAIALSMASNCDSESTKSLGSSSSSNCDTKSTENLVDSKNSRSTIAIAYELIKIKNELSTTADFRPDDFVYRSWSPSTVDHLTWTTQSDFTIDDGTYTDNNTMDTICDPAWPENATNTKEVVALRVNNTCLEWITVVWEPPCKNATNHITYSVERCDNEKNCNQTIQTDTWHNATNLSPCTEYTFNVSVITDFWRSDGNNVSAKTSHAIREIGDVLNLNVSDIGVDTMRLTWQPPVKNAKCILNYTITQCDRHGKSCNDSATVIATNYIANNLEPCTFHHYTVKTVTKAVKSVGVNVTEKTISPKLSQPQFLNITPESFSLIAEWESPQSGSICLQHYRVTVKLTNSTLNHTAFNVTGTNKTITDLLPCTYYDVTVNAVNKNDGDGDVIFKICNTSPARINPPVCQTQDFINASSVSITWSIARENPCPLVYIVTTCNHVKTKGSGYKPDDKKMSRTFLNSTTADHIVVISTTVTDLSPFTIYNCSAYIFNGENSEISNITNITTLENVPSPPEFNVTKITDSQFSLVWKPPNYLPGNLKDFEIKLIWQPLFPIPDWCSPDESNRISVTILNGSTFHYDFLKVTAFTNYTVTMRAKTGAIEWSNSSAPKIFQSHYGVPGAVWTFSHDIKESSNDTNVLETILTWKLPCSLNGKLEAFNISVYGTRHDYAAHSFFTMKSYTDYNNYTYSETLRELKGEYNYTFAVSTKVSYVDTLGPTRQFNVLYPAGIPPQPDDEYIKSITIDPYKITKTTRTASILLPMFPSTNGDIKYYAIMISESGYNKQSSMRFDLKSKTWPNVSSWKESEKSGFSITYQATQPEWSPNSNNIIKGDGMKAVKYMIGEDTTCKEWKAKRVYCNGPLKPGTWYDVRMRAFTSGGYADSEIFIIKTDAEFNIAIVIGVVFGILFLGILTTMMLLVRKCSPYVVLRRFLHSDMPGSPVPAPFTRKKFIVHYQQLVGNPGKLSNEFRLLQTLSVDLQMPTNTACLQANRKKNRYSDILPYDFSRVKLEVIDNDPNTDYINASFIRGYTGEDEYIACQGPKEETTYDFWRMIDQYNINIIVMLTELIEKGKDKCHQYYPTIRETFRYENMTIKCMSELDFRTHTQRTLVLQKENRKRNIIHLHFKDWPDHDVPEDFDPMINFCQIMRRNISANKGFVVVHCSAGIGRTGTLIAIDILLQHIRDNRKLDVFGTVYRLRHHRINMVQRESQYAYIYNCIKQVLKNPYFLKTCKPPPVDPIYENISKKTTNPDTNLVNNFEMCA